MDCGYFGVKEPLFNVQRLVNGEWVSFVEDVGATAYMMVIREYAEAVNYRVVDNQGVVVFAPMVVIN